ncbi:hypothetical protein B6D29_04895 [Microgenomates bacterium UTCPR1]|nr:YraN family protein [Patescibacteria group bacterium]OQY64620.1 MAG: hypothetical protein B6D29_04895 [Microgenomates bacterium UTCPR1]
MNLYPRSLGKIGEQKASVYLKEKGYSVIHKNFRSRLGEIDIVAKKDMTIYFVEVKLRTNLSKGQPYEAVTKIKLSHLKRAAQYFLLKYPFKGYKYRLSVISILSNEEGDKIKFYDTIY